MPVRGKNATGIRTTMLISDVMRIGRSRMGAAVEDGLVARHPLARAAGATRSIMRTATVIIMPVRITTARIETVEKVWPAR